MNASTRVLALGDPTIFVDTDKEFNRVSDAGTVSAFRSLRAL